MTSQVGKVPLGQWLASGVSEYRTAKACSRLSLLGRPPAPSFQDQDAMSCGSLEPPPVKMVALTLLQPRPLDPTRQSPVHDTAVAPVVTSVVPQPLVPPPVTWLQTLSQSSTAAGTGGLPGCVAEEASPSSWKRPVSWTAC